MTAPASTSWLDSIPGARSAMNYVLGQVANFQAVPSRLQNVGLWLNKIVTTTGGPAAAQAQALQATMQEVSGQYATTAAKVSDLLPQLQGAGLLGLDLGMIGNLLDVAAGIGSTLAATQGVEEGTASLAQQSGVGTFTPGAGGISVGKYLVYGGLFYVGLWALKKAKGSRRF